MILKALHLVNFRNFRDEWIYFSPGMNSVLGKNGQGKSSLIEAISLLHFGRSFRTSKLTDLVMWGCSHFLVEAHFSKLGVEQKLSFWSDGKNRRIEYNSNPVRSMTSLLGIFQGVVMTPGDALLIKGAPSFRRDFFNIQLAQVDPLYVHYLSRYVRAKSQRMALLRRRETVTLDSWEYEMARSGAYVIEERKKLTEDLSLELESFYSLISETQLPIQLTYQPALDQLEGIEERLREKFKSDRLRDRELRQTRSGPHKDDWTIFLDEKNARSFASEGQQRSLALAFHFAEWNRLSSRADDAPMMLCDDLISTLDQNRREKVWEKLSSFEQSIVTLTDPLGVCREEEAHQLMIEAGRVGSLSVTSG